jgi:hypothetical protein
MAVQPNSDNTSFDSRWFKNVPAAEVDALKAQLLGDKKTLDKIKEICYNIVKNEEDVRIDDYETPSWSHKMAHRLGYLEAIRTVARLVDLDKNEPA